MITTALHFAVAVVAILILAVVVIIGGAFFEGSWASGIMCSGRQFFGCH